MSAAEIRQAPAEERPRDARREAEARGWRCVSRYEDRAPGVAASVARELPAFVEEAALRLTAAACRGGR